MRKLIKYFWPLLLILFISLLDMFSLYSISSDTYRDSIQALSFPLIGIYYLYISHPTYKYFYAISVSVLLMFLSIVISMEWENTLLRSIMDTKLSGDFSLGQLIFISAMVSILIFYTLRFFDKKQKKWLAWGKWLCVVSLFALVAMLVVETLLGGITDSNYIGIIASFLLGSMWLMHIIDLYRMDRSDQTDYDSLIEQITGEG